MPPPIDTMRRGSKTQDLKSGGTPTVCFAAGTGTATGIGRSGGGFFVLVDGHRFQVLGFKNLVAVEAADVIDPVPPRHHLGPTVGAEHTKYPYSMRVRGCVK